MNSGATAERVFAVLKHRIMGHEFRPGDHLDPSVLATQLAASVTPVRDALNRLTGEGLVETRTGGGFSLPALDEPRLKDLYGWSAELILLAIRSWPPSLTPAAPPPFAETPSIAEQTAAAFLAIGQLSTNSEHARAIERLSARLHAVREVEGHVLSQLDQELVPWADATAAGDRDSLRRLCQAYHRRRTRAAGDIVRAVYRA